MTASNPMPTQAINIPLQIGYEKKPAMRPIPTRPHKEFDHHRRLAQSAEYGMSGLAYTADLRSAWRED